jgi:hypothetical protein
MNKLFCIGIILLIQIFIDKETRQCFDHTIQVLNKDTFEITNDNFTTTGTDSDDIENPDLKGLD